MRFPPLLILVLPLVASAQTAPSPPMAPPPVGHASRYLSPFDGYRRFADQPPQNWVDANDLVRRIGGWQAYARESQEAAKNAESKESPGASGGGHDARPR